MKIFRYLGGKLFYIGDGNKLVVETATQKNNNSQPKVLTTILDG